MISIGVTEVSVRALFAKDVYLPPIIHFLIAAVSSSAGLLLTQGLISNRTEKLVTGMAAIWIPMGYLLVVSALTLARGRMTAARILAGQPTSPRLTP